MATHSEILLTNANIIDGQGAAPIRGAIAIRDNVILGVGELSSMTSLVSPETSTLDLGGLTVMPGLIDSHCHITFDEPQTNDELFFHRREGLAALVASVNAQKVLRAGFTSLFDADCIFDAGIDLRDAIEAGVVPGPRMTTGGNVLINCVGGTASRLLPDRGRRGYGMIVHTKDEIVTEIHRQVKAGVDWIKVHVSGMPIRSHGQVGEIQTWQLDELKLVCDTAHQLGVPVVGHCRNASSTRDAAIAGFDMILHATYMDETAIQAVVDHKVPLVPTFTFQANLADYGEAIGADSTLQAIFREEIVQSAGPLTEVFKAGVPILSGSESGFSLTPYGHWHYRELKILETVLGMSALEAIQSATQHGAIALRSEGQLGVLAKGYLADLICVEGDVLSDLDCLGRPGTIRHIMKNGRWVDCSKPLPDTWSIPGWRVSEFSSEVLTRQRAEQALGPL